MRTIALDNDSYTVEIAADHGIITRIFDKVGGIEILAEPRLSDNFRLLLPLPGTEANYILGSEQLLTGYERTGDGVHLRWDGPMVNSAGEWKISVGMEIALIDHAVQFRMHVRNGTAHELAEVWCPILGGITGIGDRLKTKVVIPYSAPPAHTDLFRYFPESMGVGGGASIRYPEYSLP